MSGESTNYQPISNGGKVDLAVLKSEVVHGFEWVDRRLTEFEAKQQRNTDKIDTCSHRIGILEATALRIDAIRMSAVVGGVVIVIMAVATVAGKLAGWF